MVIPYRTAKLNLPIFLQWRFGAQPPNLIPANISGYTILLYLKLFGYIVCCVCIIICIICRSSGGPPVQLLGSEGGGGQGQSSKGKVMWPEMGTLEWLVCKQVREEVEKEKERERDRQTETERERETVIVHCYT